MAEGYHQGPVAGNLPRLLRTRLPASSTGKYNKNTC